MHSWATEIFFYKFLTKKNKQIGLFYLNSWYYNAAGVKVSKNAILGLSTANNLQTSNTLYLGGYQYNNDVLQFFPHAQGYVRYNVHPDTGAKYFDYVYQYKDHLENIRINYTFDTSTGSLKVLEENHYYPFGLKHTNNQYTRDIKEEKETVDGEDKWEKKVVQVPNSGYQYKYNGKEWQDELNLNVYDYDNRVYDPSYVRFWQPDPLAEQGRRWSPYNYCFNNPIYFQDPDGMWPFPTGGMLNLARNLTAKVSTKIESAKKEVSKQVNLARQDLAQAGEKLGFAHAGRWLKEQAKKISGGVDFKVDDPENVNEGLASKGQGNKKTPVVKIDDVMVLTNVHGPENNLPGSDLRNANPESEPSTSTATNTATINNTSTPEQSETVEVSIPKINLFANGNSSQSATKFEKDTLVKKQDAQKVVNEEKNKTNKKIENFNKKYGTDF